MREQGQTEAVIVINCSEAAHLKQVLDFVDIELRKHFFCGPQRITESGVLSAVNSKEQFWYSGMLLQIQTMFLV